jgi:hypothetical protein
MGWAYTAAWLDYFHVNPLNLEIGITEYALRGLRLFSPPLVLITAVIVVAVELRLVELPPMADSPRTVLHRAAGRVRGDGPRWIRGAGIALAVCGLVLYFARGRHYYLLPVGWTRNLDATYVLQDGDGIRVELYAGTR